MSAALAYETPPENLASERGHVPHAANDNASGTLVHVDEATDGRKTDYIGKIVRIKTENGTSTPTWLHMDQLGSAQTGTSANGTVAWREHPKSTSSHSLRAQYTPYGTTLTNPLSNKDQAGYTGHIKDSATGLNYMQARYYDPLIGRFLSIDPVGFSVGQPFMFNRYTYVNNDPVNLIDPFGMQADDPEGNNTTTAASAGMGQPLASGEAIDLTNQTMVSMVPVGRAASAGAGAVKKIVSKIFKKKTPNSKPTIKTRTTRQGEPAVNITKKDGSYKDISPSRVKEGTPNTDPRAPSGTTQKTKFENAQPGSKGYKRDPTPKELKQLKDLTKND